MATKEDNVDIAAIGKALYEEVRAELEATHKGKAVIP
jgi:hypothetical protein